jgi:hypothetical protein
VRAALRGSVPVVALLRRAVRLAPGDAAVIPLIRPQNR